MADEQIVTSIVAKADLSSLVSEVHRATASLQQLQRELLASNKSIASATKVANNLFRDTLTGSGYYSSHFVNLNSDVDRFGKQLDAGRLKLKDYFQTFRTHATTQKGMIRELAKEQVMLQNAVLQPLGRNAQGLMQYNVMIPRGLDAVKNSAQLARMEMQIMNRALLEGSTSLINWGKNTQWAGRQLTVGLTVPLAMFGTQAAKAFREADQELTRLVKVYGDISGTASADLQKIRGEVTATAKELSSAMGVSFKETIGLAADIAATGQQGDQLLGSLKETTRLAVLGEVDRAEAMKATLAIQTAFKSNTQELTESINFLNAVENQTSTTLNDLVEAIPKAGTVVKQLGGDVEDLALYLTAMREGGVNASEAANALKSGLASMINPTKQTVGLMADFGIDILGMVEKNAGSTTGMILDLQKALDGLDPLSKARALEQMFGKFQFARMSALFNNLGKEGSQTLQVMQLMNASAEDLANVASRELSLVTESASGKYKRAVESLKASMADIGEEFLGVATKFINAFTKVLDFFNNLPEPIKKAVTYLGGFTAIIGPVIMLTGVLANFFGYITKGVVQLRAFFQRAAGWKMLTPEIIAAEKAAQMVEQAFYSDAAAAEVLHGALAKLVADYTNLQSAMLKGSIPTNPVLSTVGGTMLPIRREVDPSNAYAGAMDTRAMSHINVRDPKNPASLMGVVPGALPVNRSIGRTPQMYMNERLPNIEGLTSVKGVSTGIVAGEAARFHALMATLGMQTEAEVAALKQTISMGGTVSKDLLDTFDDILPLTSKIADGAATQSAAIVAQLRAGKITVDQAKAEIVALNAQIDAMLRSEISAYAGARGRTIDFTKAPLMNQPVVDANGQFTLRDLYKKEANKAVMEEFGRLRGVRTFGAPYSMHVTRLPKFNDGGGVETFGPNKTTVSGPSSIGYDDRLGSVPVGGYVLNQSASLNPVNRDLVALAPYTYSDGGEITAALTPKETVFGPNLHNIPGLYDALESANNGFNLGGSIIKNIGNYGALPVISGDRVGQIYDYLDYLTNDAYPEKFKQNAILNDATALLDSGKAKDINTALRIAESDVSKAIIASGGDEQKYYEIRDLQARARGLNTGVVGARQGAKSANRQLVAKAMRNRGYSLIFEHADRAHLFPISYSETNRSYYGQSIHDPWNQYSRWISQRLGIEDRVPVTDQSRYSRADLIARGLGFEDHDDMLLNRARLEKTVSSGRIVGIPRTMGLLRFLGKNSGGPIPGYMAGGNLGYLYSRALSQGQLKDVALPRTYLMKALGATSHYDSATRRSMVSSLPMNPNLSMFDSLPISKQAKLALYDSLAESIQYSRMNTLDKNIKRGFGSNDTRNIWHSALSGALVPSRAAKLGAADIVVLKGLEDKISRLQSDMPPSVAKKLFGGKLKLNRGGVVDLSTVGPLNDPKGIINYNVGKPSASGVGFNRGGRIPGFAFGGSPARMMTRQQEFMSGRLAKTPLTGRDLQIANILKAYNDPARKGKFDTWTFEISGRGWSGSKQISIPHSGNFTNDMTLAQSWLKLPPGYTIERVAGIEGTSIKVPSFNRGGGIVSRSRGAYGTSDDLRRRIAELKAQGAISSEDAERMKKALRSGQAQRVSAVASEVERASQAVIQQQKSFASYQTPARESDGLVGRKPIEVPEGKQYRRFFGYTFADLQAKYGRRALPPISPMSVDTVGYTGISQRGGAVPGNAYAPKLNNPEIAGILRLTSMPLNNALDKLKDTLEKPLTAIRNAIIFQNKVLQKPAVLSGLSSSRELVHVPGLGKTYGRDLARIPEFSNRFNASAAALAARNMLGPDGTPLPMYGNLTGTSAYRSLSLQANYDENGRYIGGPGGFQQSRLAMLLGQQGVGRDAMRQAGRYASSWRAAGEGVYTRKGEGFLGLRRREFLVTNPQTGQQEIINRAEATRRGIYQGPQMGMGSQMGMMMASSAGGMYLMGKDPKDKVLGMNPQMAGMAAMTLGATLPFMLGPAIRGLNNIKAMRMGGDAAAKAKDASVLFRFLSPAKFLAFSGAITAATAALVVMKKLVNNWHQDAVNRFGLTAKAAEQLGIEHINLAEKMKAINAANAAANASKFAGISGVPGLMMSPAELGKLASDAKEKYGELIETMNRADNTNLLPFILNLKAQMLGAGKSVEETNKAILGMVTASNHADKAFSIFSNSGFRKMTDRASAARQLFVQLRNEIDNPGDQFGTKMIEGFTYLTNNADSAIKSLVGTKNAQGEVIDEAMALNMVMKEMSTMSGYDKVIGTNAFNELPKELQAILNDTDTIGGSIAKWQLYVQNTNFQLKTMSSETANALVAWNSAFDSAVTSLEKAGGTESTFGRIGNALSRLQKVQDAVGAKAQRAAQISQRNAQKEIELINKKIQAIENEKNAKLEALRATRDAQSYQLGLEKLQLQYQDAIASGDMVRAAEIQIDIRQLTADRQLQLAEQAIEDAANKKKKPLMKQAESIRDSENKKSQNFQDAQYNAQTSAKTISELQKLSDEYQRILRERSTISADDFDGLQTNQNAMNAFVSNIQKFSGKKGELAQEVKKAFSWAFETDGKAKNFGAATNLPKGSPSHLSELSYMSNQGALNAQLNRDLGLVNAQADKIVKGIAGGQTLANVVAAIRQDKGNYDSSGRPMITRTKKSWNSPTLYTADVSGIANAKVGTKFVGADGKTYSIRYTLPNGQAGLNLISKNKGGPIPSARYNVGGPIGMPRYNTPKYSAGGQIKYGRNAYGNAAPNNSLYNINVELNGSNLNPQDVAKAIRKEMEVREMMSGPGRKY